MNAHKKNNLSNAQDVKKLYLLKIMKHMLLINLVILLNLLILVIGAHYVIMILLLLEKLDGKFISSREQQGHQTPGRRITKQPTQQER